MHLPLVDEYAALGAYPAIMPVEVRVTGPDHAGDVHLPNAAVPGLSAVRPVEGSGWDVAVWLDLLTLRGGAWSAADVTDGHSQTWTLLRDNDPPRCVLESLPRSACPGPQARPSVTTLRPRGARGVLVTGRVSA